MSEMPFHKYRPFPRISLPDRRWPENNLTHAPIWCSVDLRDGNQALVDPMGSERKSKMFDLLVRMGFKHIEIGFPSASQLEYDFTRQLIEQDLIPDDVSVQVLVQAREPLIRRTMEAVRGAKRAIIHLYNSTSELQRRVVFGKDRQGIMEIALKATRLIQELAAQMPETEILLEYSPESFSATEVDFAVEICDAVIELWRPSPKNKMILDLPATVEVAGPHVYADQIEWFGRHLKGRDSVILSVHTHNDRGTAVAAAELALMAGADRLEGTLFGNGERTGNVDLVTVAMNLFSQGVDPELDLRDIDSIRKVVEECNRLPVSHRHPYVGEFVYTAFSGSHQDAIRKGLVALHKSKGKFWEVPYLPIDPADVGRTYEAVVRINSQSGKGGIGYILEKELGIIPPKDVLVEFSGIVQKMTEDSGAEMKPEEIVAAFQQKYLLTDVGSSALEKASEL